MDYDVFISYSSEDKAFADALCHHLEEQGVKCWIAPRDIFPGRSWRDSIVEAIEVTPFMALLFSTNSSNSEQVKKELEVAADTKKIIVIPVRVENIEPTGTFKYELRGRHWLDAFGEEGQDHIRRASEQITEQVKKVKVSLSIPPERQTNGEEKLLNALKLAYTDGKITDAERDMINTLSMQEGIAPERLEELENQVRSTLEEESTPEQKPAPPKEMEWPEIGLVFLRNLKKALAPDLPFEPKEVSDEEGEEEDESVWWYVTENHYYAAWLLNKRTPNVTLGWGFASDYDKRDPLFRTIAEEIQARSVVPDADDDQQEPGYYFLKEGELSVEAEKRVRIEDLADASLLEETAAHFKDFMDKTWPVIREHYGK